MGGPGKVMRWEGVEVGRRDAWARLKRRAKWSGEGGRGEWREIALRSAEPLWPSKPGIGVV